MQSKKLLRQQRRCVVTACLALALSCMLFCAACGNKKETDIFNLGDVTLIAATSETGGSQTVAVTDGNGSKVLSIEATLSGAKLTLPDETTHPIAFDEPLAGLPASGELNLAAAFLAYQFMQEPESGGGSMRRDAPGCDMWYDFQCMLGCCAEHDQCYDENGCRFFSWSLIYDSDPACRDCNDIAFACILQSCYEGRPPKSTGSCYDNRCDMYYDCPSGYCDCTSPCDLEICDNKKDDDGDTFIDCADAGCAGHSACTEICDNDIDDDGDTLVDCDDADCAGHPACVSGSTTTSSGTGSSTTTIVAQELRWVLAATATNPGNEPTEFAGGPNGYPDGWYCDPRYDGKTRSFTITANSISMHDREWDNTLYHDVTLTSSFATPPETLVPQSTLTFDISLSHSGTVTLGGGTGLTFIYLVNGYWNGNGYCYTPWNTNCSDDPYASFDIRIPSASKDSEFTLGVGWLNCAACTVVWTYEAQYQ